MKKTKLIKINTNQPDPEVIKEAARVILDGGLVVFPTDTLYGIGGNFFDLHSIRKIYKVKQRPENKPLIALIGSKEDLDSLVSSVSRIGQKLIEKYWPGPLTIIFRASVQIPKSLLAGGDTIAVRMPNSTISLSLLKETGVPLTSPSANISGEPVPMTGEKVYEKLKGKIDIILDGGFSKKEVPSTLVDITKDPPEVLRKGAIDIENDLKNLI